MANGKPCINLKKNKHGHILLQGATGFFTNKKLKEAWYTPDGGPRQEVHITDRHVRGLNPPGDDSAAAISIHGLKANFVPPPGGFRGHYSVFSGTLLITLINNDDTGPDININITGDFYVDDPGAIN